MRNYVDNGDTVTVPAPYDVASGGGAQIGTLFGVAQSAAKAAAPVVLVTRGSFDLPKAASQAWAIGAAIYWDDDAKACTTVSTDNVLIGKATTVISNGASAVVGRVRLNG